MAEHEMATMEKISHPWVLIRYGGNPPGTGTALAFLEARTEPGCFFGDGYFGNLVTVEWSGTTGQLNVRKRNRRHTFIASPDILYVFPCCPSPFNVREARKALRAQREAGHGRA